MQSALAPREGTRWPDDEARARDRIKIALWLRREFADEPPTPQLVDQE